MPAQSQGKRSSTRGAIAEVLFCSTTVKFAIPHRTGRLFLQSYRGVSKGARLDSLAQSAVGDDKHTFGADEISYEKNYTAAESETTFLILITGFRARKINIAETR